MNRSEMKKFVQGINAEQASQVVRFLLDDADLTEKIYDAAIKVVGSVDLDDIKADVCYELDMLDVEEMGNRSGRTRHGYVEPTEAAWEMFEEALDPFIDEMKKNQKRGMPAAAKAYCIGIIKGLRSYEKESSSDFKEWVNDAPGEYVYTVINEWRKDDPSEEDIAEVMVFVEDG